MVKHNVEETESNTFSCTVCGKQYQSLWLVNRHMNSHSTEKKNSCHICGRSYVQAWSLKTHMMSHEGRPQAHTCKVCGKVFGSVSLVNRHMISHSGTKQHFCPVCGNGFTQSWSLKTHMLKHAPHKQLTSGVDYVKFLSEMNSKFLVVRSIKTEEEETVEASQSLETTGTQTEINASLATPVPLLDSKQSPSGGINNDIKELPYVKTEVIDSGDDDDDFVNA